MAHTFSVANTFGRGQELKSNLATAEQAREFNSLRATGERQRQDLQQRTFDADQQRVNTEKLLTGIRLAKTNPSILPQVGQELVASGILNEAELPAMLERAQSDPQSFQQGLADFEAQLMFALGQAPRRPTAEVETFEKFTEGLPEEDVLSARRIDLGLEARAGTTSARERIATDPELTTDVAASVADIAGATETAKQAAQIEAIPERVQAQFKSDFKAGSQKRIRAANDAISRIDSVMQEAQLAIDDIGVTTTGLLGSINRQIAGTTAFALARKIDTIQANLSFDRIAEMRKNSPTGGALGQVSERELSLLGSAVVALDQANNEAEVKRAFTKILFHYNNWKAVLTGQKEADALLQEGDVLGIEPEQRPTATGPNGEKLTLINGQWVPDGG